MAYVFFIFAFIVNFSIVHDLIATVIGFFNLKTFNYLGSFDHRVTIFTLSLLICSLLITLLSRFMPVKELYVIIHSWKKCIFTLCYMIICTIVLILDSAVTAFAIFNGNYDEQLLTLIYTDLIAKDLLILACSYIMLFQQCSYISEEEKSKQLSGALLREKNFRQRTRQNDAASFIFNITTNKIEEGEHFFNQNLLEIFRGNLKGFLNYIVMNCLHPDDRYALSGNKAMMNEKGNEEQDGKTMTTRFRMNSAVIDDVFNMPLSPYRTGDNSERWVWFESKFVFVKDENTGDIIHYVDITDIDSIVMAENNLIAAAKRDHLTGLCNRASIEESIIHCLSALNTGGTMFIMDVDNFKTVNDSLGHQTGDELLKKLAADLKNTFRSNDIIGRMGGDEFCVFIPALNDEQLIKQMAMRLLEKVHYQYEINGKITEITLSVGIAIAPKHGNDYNTLYKHSDIALYKAKHAGKNNYKFYERG